MIQKVLITQPIDPQGMQILEDAGFIVDVWPGPEPIPDPVLRDRVQGCSGIISMLTDPIDADLMARGPLRVVAQHAVGINNIDLEAAASQGVRIGHTPGVLTHPTADLAMALLLSTARRIVESDRYVRAGNWKGWSPTLMRGMELNGAVLGIVGMGRIGQAVAHRAEAFGMKIIHHGRTRGCDLGTLLAESDIVSLHCPLTPQTHHLIGEKAFERMKTSAILINTARGSVVDEAALVKALEHGQIAGAGLDVFEEEPTVHPGLIANSKVVILPHIGSATRSTRRKMGEMVATDMVLGLQGESMLHEVKS